ncbi:lipocalin family protein [Maricaulis sp. CAU 1757]
MRLALLLPLLALIGCAPQSRLADDAPAMAPVPSVDLERYAGRWFEIFRADHGFESGCHGVMAEYERNADGIIAVTNTCFKGGLDGERDVAEGRARVVEGSNNAKLEVSFFGPFWGDYWVIDLADDYSWAIVSEPQGRYLWMLAREPQPGQAVIDARLADLEARGFDTDGLIFPEQWDSADAVPEQ